MSDEELKLEIKKTFDDIEQGKTKYYSEEEAEKIMNDFIEML